MEHIERDCEFFFEIKGSGKPILMIHGFTPDHRLMKGCMEPIFHGTSNWMRIYFDLPGMGKTKAPSWIICADDLMDCILKLVDKIIPNQNFVIVAESYGGYLARGILTKRPELIDGLLLICPCVIPDRTKRDLPLFKPIIENQEMLNGLEDDLKDHFRSLVVQNERTWLRYSEEILPALQIADHSFLTRFQEIGYELSFDVDSVDRPFAKPTLILLGQQDDVVGYKDALKILGNYPRATFAVLDKAGHNLQIEQEKVFETLVKEWLGRVTECSMLSVANAGGRDVG